VPVVPSPFLCRRSETRLGFVKRMKQYPSVHTQTANTADSSRLPRFRHPSHRHGANRRRTRPNCSDQGTEPLA